MKKISEILDFILCGNILLINQILKVEFLLNDTFFYMLVYRKKR